MKNIKSIILLAWLLFAFIYTVEAQNQTGHITWRQVRNQNAEWYSGAEAKRIADNVLIYQHKTGGWPKNIDMAAELDSKEVEVILKGKKDRKNTLGQPTMDNDATFAQLVYLSKVYEQTKEKRYHESILRGINYLLEAQYKNGGWPQFYPVKKGYYEHITYNDNAMVNTMLFIRDVAEGADEFAALGIDEELKEKLRTAFEKGVECILKTQIIVNGEPTVWCAQHDENTLAPAKARSYELPSFSGAESAGIVALLMDIDNPTQEIVKAIKGAVTWFENHKIEGIRVEFTRNNGERDRKVITDDSAPAIWARFYDLESEEPYFCDRDGIKKKTMAEIGIERRGGYSWYTYNPQKVLNKYPEWAAKWGVK